MRTVAVRSLPNGELLRVSAVAFQERQKTGNQPIVLDIHGQSDWDRSDAKDPVSARADPASEIRIDPG